MTATDLARRFLHINLNTVNAEAAQAFLTDCLGLGLQMQTDPEELVDGEILGLPGKVRCDTRFFYDSRGPRFSCAIEVIHWLDPPTTACRALDAASGGLSALAFRVADRGRTVETIRDHGYRVLSEDAVGLVTGGPAAVAVGPDGLVVELADMRSGATGGVQFAGARVTCADLAESLRFYTGIGFNPLGETRTRTLPLCDLGLDVDDSDDVQVCHVGLAEDGPTVRLCLTQAAAGARPAARQPNEQGLYRCALRVENTPRAIAATAEDVVVRGPIWCPLPGTPIAGLHIAFLTAPEGTVIEYVERPLEHFA
ncbi:MULTISPECIES: VOC family protein [Mycobacterium]|uniref:VOC domain-containing protein n=1 Tax=Mycobacterium paraseoulense TaxID=590652 RepID=A0A1X0I7Z0_9MYCO|nr:VOC family protein [Mycobacterium paraseoulense]MCV7393956.1 VOC family protein [Mycobacterium paraseoulense]ORB38390.1 hypothetical protein BST39_17325 [Mycobacterium paraseoulense]BBZ70414.1 hypothetical protein MPRS_15070 [Mycobacterium paraseoulense]